MTLRIATRRSPLALWQAEHVAALLRQAHPGLAVELVPLTTSGDRWLDRPLSEAGGKGLFVKELEEALLERRADLAVHSMKDVPAQQPPGLGIAALLAAEDPRDAFVSNRHATLDALPQGARVGTSSLRRRAQLLALRPDLRMADLRGNVGTRLARLDAGDHDAIVLATAGLARLGLAGRIRERLEPARFLPAIGQGVIGVECRSGDDVTLQHLAPLHDANSGARLAAERALNARLGGSCQAPVAGHAVLAEAGRQEAAPRLVLTGLVASPDGRQVVKRAIEGHASAAAQLGETLAGQLLSEGGRDILRAIGALP